MSQRFLGVFVVRVELKRGPQLFLPILPVAGYCQAHKKKGRSLETGADLNYTLPRVGHKPLIPNLC
ncbi:MAG TPA: hypothetical protein VKO18_15390 [Terriglobia bacterium]|nr:hypothetical protein [Terriglobia bacterium]